MKKIWYEQEAQNWNEATPLGNARIGAMLFSGAVYDRIQFNEETLWSGCPEGEQRLHSLEVLKEGRRLLDERNYVEAEKVITAEMFGGVSQCYQTACDLIIEHDSQEDYFDYRRELDLETAVHKCEYSFGRSPLCQSAFRTNTSLSNKNYAYTYENPIAKEAFVSYPDNVFVYKITSKDKDGFSIYPACKLKHTLEFTADEIHLHGECTQEVKKFEKGEAGDHITFDFRVKVITDGLCRNMGGSLSITGATNTVLVIAAASSFIDYKTIGADSAALSRNTLDKALEHTYDELKERHIRDYRSLFDRVSFSLGEDNGLPTDVRIKNYSEDDVQLAELLFDFGRYLMISGSREGTQPLPLQGIWNREVLPPWNGAYTMNINTEMNYWPAEACDLGECHMPLFGMLRDFSDKGNCFGLKGWASWHNSDIWRYNADVTKEMLWGYWPMGGFWCCRHIWEHYLYTKDKDFLADMFGVLEGAAQFLQDWLILDSDGYYTTSPSTSPENRFVFDGKLCAAAKGSAMDLAICRELFTYIAEACDILGKPSEVYKEYASKIKPLAIGSDGRILEWNEEFEEDEPGHRHLSHLYCLFPSDQALPGTEYYEAARKSLEARLACGGGHTGWSNAWIANLYARLGNGEGAVHCIDNMFKKAIYPNMFDAHPPFQIDGNFGMVSAICEMLLQSHAGGITPLPALPEKWKKGRIDGIRARDGKRYTIEWEDGKLSNIQSK